MNPFTFDRSSLMVKHQLQPVNEQTDRAHVGKLFTYSINSVNFLPFAPDFSGPLRGQEIRSRTAFHHLLLQLIRRFLRQIPQLYKPCRCILVEGSRLVERSQVFVKQ